MIFRKIEELREKLKNLEDELEIKRKAERQICHCDCDIF